MSQTNKWIISITRRIDNQYYRKTLIASSLDEIFETLKDESYNLSEDMFHLSVDRYYGEREPERKICESIASTN